MGEKLYFVLSLVVVSSVMSGTCLASGDDDRFEKVVPGDRVFSNKDDSAGTVLEMSGSMINVKYDRGFTRVTKRRDLGKASSCYKDKGPVALICKNERVYNTEYGFGTVEEVFRGAPRIFSIFGHATVNFDQVGRKYLPTHHLRDVVREAKVSEGEKKESTSDKIINSLLSPVANKVAEKGAEKKAKATKKAAKKKTARSAAAAASVISEPASSTSGVAF
ncbi:MAG: hypothetical protein A2428_05865 [Bdellovibrionales bacterium RIFOXYC1_FULL_54_43]|nr:MAG: hypothetical protein A2428_05865 [Bdellovibrionales bacterium RIFOXYC1_FULL_54_43]OFZ80921.1 MAG: hypothetical protein A2603_14125 [Bdellovibrionales bacterium RIFOXYD1_FULL_55_31]